MKSFKISNWKTFLFIEILIRTILYFSVKILKSNVAPFQRIILREDWHYYLFPYRSDSIPYGTLSILTGKTYGGYFTGIAPMFSMILALFLNLRYFNKKVRAGKKWRFLMLDVYDFIMAYTLSHILCTLLTYFVKLIYGRPRPFFFNVCFPEIDLRNQTAVNLKLDDIDIFNLTCSDQTAQVRGRKSFPSGHTSIAFSQLILIAFYIWGKFQAFSKTGKGKSWRFLISWPFILTAVYVGLSRTRDYKHHTEDVIAGALLGIFVAYVCYRIYFPSLKSSSCNLSYSQIKWVLKLPEEDLVEFSRKELTSMRSQVEPYE